MKFFLGCIAALALAGCSTSRCQDWCDGCCTTEGHCVAGTTQDACGAAGASCVACWVGEACVEQSCRSLEPDGGPGAFEGTLWVMGALTDGSRFEVARVAPRRGVRELVQLVVPGAPSPVFSAAAVSDDGQWLAVVLAGEDPSRRDLYVARPDGTGARRLVTGTPVNVLDVVSVSASRALWLDDTRAVFSTPLDGGATVRATPSTWAPVAGRPMWVTDSLDHRWVSVVAELDDAPGAGRVWVTDVEAPVVTPVEVLTAAQTGASTRGLGADSIAAFTPNGRVVFEARFDATSGLPWARPDGGTGWRIVTVQTDGGDVRQLATGPSGAWQSGSWGLSPDGRTLAFTMNPGSGGHDVYVLPADESQPAREISAGHAAGGAPRFAEQLIFSPDGRALACTANWSMGTAYDLYVLATDGTGELRRWPGPPGKWLKGPLAWSPDGRHLAFLSDHLADGPLQVFTMEAAGTRTVPTMAWPVGPGGRVSQVKWTP
jgi:hypothetical protein